jgi:hypothetical protein
MNDYGLIYMTKSKNKKNWRISAMLKHCQYLLQINSDDDLQTDDILFAFTSYIRINVMPSKTNIQQTNSVSHTHAYV